MKTTEKAYRYKYDPQTRLYSGITREKNKSNSTDIQPHFESGFHTVWDHTNKQWMLIDREEYFNRMAEMNQQLEFETELKKWMYDEFGSFYTKLKHATDHVHNIDHMLKRESNECLREIKHVEKLVDYGNNQSIKHTSSLAVQITGLSEHVLNLQRSINNLNTQLVHVKFELEIPFWKRVLRFFRLIG